MKHFFEEFKKFAMRGNVIDFAVGLIIGAAFGKITSSIVNDIIMPPVGLLLGGVNFAELSIVLREATETSGAVLIRYGVFLQVVIDFLIIALVLFLFIRAINRLHARKTSEAVPPPKKTAETAVLEEIRDILKREK